MCVHYLHAFECPAKKYSYINSSHNNTQRGIFDVWQLKQTVRVRAAQRREKSEFKIMNINHTHIFFFSLLTVALFSPLLLLFGGVCSKQQQRKNTTNNYAKI